jgi:hypothetical protein
MLEVYCMHKEGLQNPGGFPFTFPPYTDSRPAYSSSNDAGIACLLQTLSGRLRLLQSSAHEYLNEINFVLLIGYSRRFLVKSKAFILLPQHPCNVSFYGQQLDL